MRSTTGEWGFNAGPAETLAIWERNAKRWPEVTSPWRPSEGDIQIYRRLIERRANGRVLVLGSTSELRDLLADLGVEPMLVELSRPMRDVTTSLLRRADPGREAWLEENWCRAELPAGRFGLALGDMIWWGLAVARQPLVRDAVSAALEPDGLFVGRIRFADPTARHADPATRVGAILDRLDDGTAHSTSVEGELLSFAYDHTADHELRRLDRARTRALLLDLAGNPTLSRHALFLRQAAERLVGADWTCQTRDELLAVLEQRFDVVDEARADDYESTWYPIVTLRKRVHPKGE